VILEDAMRSILRVLVLFGSFFAFSTGAFCEERSLPRIILSAPDTVATVGQTFEVRVYLDNFVDVIEGFQFVLRSTRPDLARFLFADTAYSPSFTGYDTTGTLTANYEYQQAINRAGNGSEIWFRCIADLPFNGRSTPPTAPQQGGVGVKFRMRLSPPAVLTDNSLQLIITTPFDFSDPFGNSIGVVTDTTWDTLLLDCMVGPPDSCTSWGPCEDTLNCDSTQITFTRHSYLDTTQVVPNHGSLVVQVPHCDNDGDGKVNLVDLLCLVSYLFGDYTCPTQNCDANGNGRENVVDLTYLVQFLFGGGPPPQ
jgi:Dockerin type I domain